MTPSKFTPTKAVFYFRTLDRWPGGNADMITVKATLRLSPGDAPELEAQFYSCFDGRHAWYPARRVSLDPGDALAPFLDVTRSLAARGCPTLAVSLLDAADEWDCDWAESEVSFFATDDGPETPDAALLRLVRRTSKSGPSAPDPELTRAFELAWRITGVGRVFQFANTQDALSAAYRSQGGAEAKDLDYAVEATPTYLPPETDAAFLTLQARAAKKRAAARAAKASRRERMLVYRLDEAPELLTRKLPPDASPRQCLFFAARYDSRVIDALIEAVPELEHDEADEAMDVAEQISRIASQSEDFARTLRPEQVPAGGSLVGGSYTTGFHGGDADAALRWLDAQGVERVSLRTFLDQLILLRVVDEDGAPLEQIDKFAGGPPVRTEDSLGDGLYVFERNRDHVRFKLAPVLDEESDPDDGSWLELRSSDLPPGAAHTVIVSAARASTKAPSKKAPSTKAPSKKAPSKKAPSKKAPLKQSVSTKTASKQTTSKKAGSKKAPSKQTPSRQTPSRKTPFKKTALKQTPSK